MKKIRTYNHIASQGLDVFPRDDYEVASEIPSPDGILLRSHKLKEETLPPTVKAIARAGAGTNNVQVEDCTRQGVVVFNTPGANANAVKELVLAGLLLSCRGIEQGVSFIRSNKDRSDAELAALMEQEKKRFKGSELAGKTLGIVGLGAIGSLVADIALALGMNVLGYDPAISVEAAWRLSSDVQKMENLQSLLAHSDYVTLHVPAIEATHHLINSDSLKSLKPGGVILNFARDSIVDTPAMLEALNSKQVGKYVSDFPVAALIEHPNALLIPHLGASTLEAEENCAVMAARQMRDYLENGNITNSVNFPTIRLERSSGYRIAFVNENVPGVLGHVLSIFTDREINVIDMLNKSRESIAYNLLDIEQEPTDELLASINEIPHVLRVMAL